MIDIKNVDIHQSMSAGEFQKVAVRQQELWSAISTTTLINVVTITQRGWAIYGHGGLYADDHGTRVFQDLRTVHGIVKSLGFKFFLEDGVLKEFS